MSSRIFQNVIIQMKDSVDRTLGVVDEQGFVVASSTRMPRTPSTKPHTSKTAVTSSSATRSSLKA